MEVIRGVMCCGVFGTRGTSFNIIPQHITQAQHVYRGRYPPSGGTGLLHVGPNSYPLVMYV